jgi:hypothetical protein
VIITKCARVCVCRTRLSPCRTTSKTLCCVPLVCKPSCFCTRNTSRNR